MELEKEAKMVEVSLNFPTESVTDENIKELSTKKIEFGKKADLLRNLFWVSVKDKYGLWNEEEIGIREGWKIVVPKDKEKFSDIIRYLFRI